MSKKTSMKLKTIKEQHELREKLDRQYKESGMGKLSIINSFIMRNNIMEHVKSKSVKSSEYKSEEPELQQIEEQGSKSPEETPPETPIKILIKKAEKPKESILSSIKDLWDTLEKTEMSTNAIKCEEYYK